MGYTYQKNLEDVICTYPWKKKIELALQFEDKDGLDMEGARCPIAPIYLNSEFTESATMSTTTRVVCTTSEIASTSDVFVVVLSRCPNFL